MMASWPAPPSGGPPSGGPASRRSGWSWRRRTTCRRWGVVLYLGISSAVCKHGLSLRCSWRQRELFIGLVQGL